MKKLTRNEMINMVKRDFNRTTLHLRFDSNVNSEDAAYWLTRFNSKLTVYLDLALITPSTFSRYRNLIERLFFSHYVNLK